MRFIPSSDVAGGTILSTLEGWARQLGRWCYTIAVFRPLVMQVWALYIRLYPWVVNGLFDGRPGTPADPFRVVPADPAEINYMVEFSALPAQARDEQMFPKSRFQYAGAVIDGDWDRTDRHFEDSELFQSFEAHFEEGIPWEETPFFDTVLDYIDQGVSMWGCRSRAEFEQRCRELDELYAAIEEHGYLSQKQLRESTIEDPIDDQTDVPYHVTLVNDELAVCVGRDGELLFKDGRDRLAIAKLLDIETIPVWVMIRHSRWQKLRRAVSEGPELRYYLRSELRSHPDLEYLWSERQR